MKAGLVIIGDELLAGSSRDGHTNWLINELSSYGVTVLETRIVGDDSGQIASAIRDLSILCDLVILTGGLGPTSDDLTREALAEAGGGSLIEDQEALTSLRERFAARGTEMPDINRVQARRPSAMQCIDNTCGTAPGLRGQLNGAEIVALPGPVAEMQTMFNAIKVSLMPDDAVAQVQITGGVFAFGMPEAVAGQRLGDLMNRDREPRVGLTASNGILHAVARAQERSEVAQEMVQSCLEKIRQAWIPWAYSCDGSTLAEVVGGLLATHELSVATAESCTGGWLGKALVDVAGSSDWYAGGWVVYSNEMKQRQLDVDAALMREGGPGAVSCEVAAALATNACQKAGSDLAISITGIAGPTGGTASKPVGTVFIGLSDCRDGQSKVIVRQFCFSGQRTQVRHRTVHAALQLCRFHVLGIEPPEPMLWEVTERHACE